MQVPRTAILCVIPFVLPACNRDSKITPFPKSVGIVENAGITKAEESSLLKLRELTDLEKKMLDEMEDFLKTYTGNGTYNYGSIDRFLEGLRCDPAGILAGAENDTERQYAEDYINNRLNPITRNIVARRINEKGKKKIEEFFKEMGVDPKTVDSPDESEVTKYVTREILLKFGDNARALKSIMEKDHDTKVAFKNGIDLKLLSFVRERNARLYDLEEYRISKK